jgi:hypothetical protein
MSPWCVVASRTSSSPAFARSKAPVQTDSTSSASWERALIQSVSSALCISGRVPGRAFVRVVLLKPRKENRPQGRLPAAFLRGKSLQTLLRVGKLNSRSRRGSRGRSSGNVRPNSFDAVVPRILKGVFR